MEYNDRQKSFFEHMANMQEASVEICMAQNKFVLDFVFGIEIDTI